MSGSGGAFVKGGCGCIVAFFAIGMFFVMIGGGMHFDAGGLVLLFAGGGVLGLIVRAVYNKGASDAKQSSQRHFGSGDVPEFRGFGDSDSEF